MCLHCQSLDWSWIEMAGTGTVYSYTVQHRASHPYFADKTPMTLALVDLDEGFRVLADLPGVADIEVGMPVEVLFGQLDDDLTLPHFRPRRREEESR